MKRPACKRTILTATFVLATSPAAAAPKPLISYFQPMPIVGKLSMTVWGASTVGPRDPANGLEDNGATGGVGAQQEAYFYWDGKILKGEDGKYHLYASRWLHSNGFGPPGGGPSGTGWEKSIPMESISDNVMGPYVAQGNCYTRNQEGTDNGHNTTALVAPTGTSPFILSVGEIVPGQMFGSSSANGPWTPLGLTQTNANGHAACGRLSSNFTFTVGPDHRFWATSRNGCVMDSDLVLGPYKVETDSVLPNLANNDNGNAEDEVIWYSGGYYHIVYNYWNIQKAYHIMSKDGITNWTSTGLAYQAAQSPPNSYSNWLRYTDGTVNQWHNMERVGVYQENGHVTHFTFAVTDVDKNSNAVNMGGSKILVVPFNGVQFDCDNGDPASCAEAAAADGGAGGSIDSGMIDGATGETGGGNGVDAAASGGQDGSDGSGGDGGGTGTSAADAGDVANDGSGSQSSGQSGGTGTGSADAAIVSAGGSSNQGSGQSGATVAADAAGVSAGASSHQGAGPNGGCGCKTVARAGSTPSLAWFGAALFAGAWIRGRHRAQQRGQNIRRTHRDRTR